MTVKKFDHKMLIDGKAVEAISSERFERISPSHDQVVGTYPLGKREDAKLAIAAARRAFDHGEWPKW